MIESIEHRDYKNSFLAILNWRCTVSSFWKRNGLRKITYL